MNPSVTRATAGVLAVLLAFAIFGGWQRLVPHLGLEGVVALYLAGVALPAVLAASAPVALVSAALGREATGSAAFVEVALVLAIFASFTQDRLADAASPAAWPGIAADLATALIAIAAVLCLRHRLDPAGR